MSEAEYISLLEHGREADAMRIVELEAELKALRDAVPPEVELLGNLVEGQALKIKKLRERIAELEAEIVSQDLLVAFTENVEAENKRLREALNQEEQFCRASGDVDRANDLAALLEGKADE